MTGELRVAEITKVKDGLHDSQVAHNNDSINGALQSQWEVIRDGLSQGMSARAQQAQDNSLLTGVEIASSFGLGAGLAMAAKAGGRWTQAAEGAGVLFAGMMGYDLTKRGMAIHDAYSSTSAETMQGQQMRKDAIAQYAGSGLVDYSLMFASGGLGAASVHFGPKFATKLSTTMEPLGRFGQLDAPALQPARVQSRFNMMDLGDVGRLGAKEKAPALASDPIEAARQRLEFPHRSVGLEQLSALMEAKQLAAHPEVKPIYEQMASTLTQVDTLKPKLSLDEQALGQHQKTLADIKSLKPEQQAVRTAEASVTGVKADIERLPALRDEQAAISRLIQDNKPASKDAPAEPRKAGKDKEPAVNLEELRQNRRELNETIANIQARAKELPNLEQRLATAQSALEARRAAIESGEDPAIKAIEAQMKPLQESVSAKKTELDTLSQQLKDLDKQIQEKSNQVRPTLGAAAPDLLSSVPKYVKPKVDLPVQERVAPPPRSKVEAIRPEPLKPIERSVERPVEKPAVAPKTEQPVEKARTSAQNDRTAQAERNERSTEKVTAPQVVKEADVNRSFSEAKQAVDDFAATHKRHTTALKKVNDYIEKAFGWFASDAEAASSAGKVAANVDAMLGKLENWDRSPAWIRPADRAQMMQRNGFDLAAMDKFDKWFQSQNKPFHDNPNMMPDRRLVDIQQHLSRRVAVESVKNYLRTAPDVNTSVSPIVQQGFDLVASGKLPDGRAIPKGSDMIVFEKRTLKGPNGDQEVVLPFAKDGQHMQRFDDVKISEGLRKLAVIKNEGPQGLPAEDLYGFRLDHDPSRLMASSEQVGFAILRPGGQYGKNMLFMKFADGLDPAIIPKSLRVDSQNGAGTNTGVLYNMLRNSAPKK